jgi:hypothetical protein
VSLSFDVVAFSPLCKRGVRGDLIPLNPCFTKGEEFYWFGFLYLNPFVVSLSNNENKKLITVRPELVEG